MTRSFDLHLPSWHCLSTVTCCFWETTLILHDVSFVSIQLEFMSCLADSFTLTRKVFGRGTQDSIRGYAEERSLRDDHGTAEGCKAPKAE